MGERPKGVLLLNLGGPDTLEAVRPFLYNLFSDRDIIKLGPPFLQKPLAWLISSMRSGKTRGYYRQIGGGSPILKITGEQASELQKTLGGENDFRVYIGMRYWKPFIRDAMDHMSNDGIRECVVLTMYPHYSIATTGSAFRELKRHIDDYEIDFDFVEQWYDHPIYVDAIAESIKRSVPDGRTEVELLYSAHSLPKSFIENGDPYVDHIKGTIELVNERLGSEGYDIRSHLAYQSRSGPVKWLEPSTDEKIIELGKTGIKELLIVPVSFVSDHIETLYEIDILYRDLALEHGIMLRRVDSLNTSHKFIEALKDIVLRKTSR
ncbi:MAG: ferrochelatase [Nitrospirota bacterium]|nr:MAG: ferrochelatase [Nitrospirota bacterium]